MTPLRGVVRGKTIDLERDPGFPDGQSVAVTLQRLSPPGDGIRASAGGWADGGEELDAWLEEMRRSRQQDRQDPA